MPEEHRKGNSWWEVRACPTDERRVALTPFGVPQDHPAAELSSTATGVRYPVEEHER